MKDPRFGFLQEYPRRHQFALGKVPLTNVPIEVVEEAVRLRGHILFAWPRDIAVSIDSPISGFHSGLHIPWFDPRPYSVFVSWRGGPSYELTPKGSATALRLLIELYTANLDSAAQGESIDDQP